MHSMEELMRGCQAIADGVQEKLPPQVGYILYLFDLSGTGHLAYLSNMETHHTVKIIEEWLIARGYAKEKQAGVVIRFAAWLTQQSPSIMVGADAEVPPMPDLARRFLEEVLDNHASPVFP